MYLYLTTLFYGTCLLSWEYIVHYMELIYYIMELDLKAMPAGGQAVLRWAGGRALIVGGPWGDMHSNR